MPVPMGYGYDPRDYVQDYSWINQMVGQLGQAATAFTQARENIKEFKTLEDSYQDGMGVALKDAEEAGISRKDATKKYNELYNVIRGKGLDWNLDRFEKAPTQWEAFVQQGFYKNKLGKGVQSAIQGTGLPKNLAPIGQPQNVETYEPSGVQGVDATSSTTMQQYQVPEWYGKPAENIEQVEQRLGEMYPDRKITREDIQSYPAARAIGTMAEQQKQQLLEEKIATEKGMQEYQKAKSHNEKLAVLRKNSPILKQIEDEKELTKLEISARTALTKTPKFKKDPLNPDVETNEITDEYVELKALADDIAKRKAEISGRPVPEKKVPVTPEVETITKGLIGIVDESGISRDDVPAVRGKMAETLSNFASDQLGFAVEPANLVKALETATVEEVVNELVEMSREPGIVPYASKYSQPRQIGGGEDRNIAQKFLDWLSGAFKQQPKPVQSQAQTPQPIGSQQPNTKYYGGNPSIY